MPTPTPEVLARRTVLCAASAWAGTALLGCASTAGRAPAASPEPPPQAVADGVFLLPGTPGEVDTANLGRTGNATLIVGPRGALMVDTGVSHRHGLARLAAARARSPQPIRAVLVTHARQEFLFGATAFQAQGIPLLMHDRAARLMQARCETCLKTLKRLLGDDAMAGTRVPRPDRLFDDTQLAELQARLSDDIGRPLRLLVSGPAGHSASPGHTAVFDEASGTLCAGALCDAQVIPDIQDADWPAWRAALDAARTLPLRHVLPGHGPASAPEAVAATARYLDSLQARIAELLRAGTPLSDIADAATLGQGFDHWAGWDTTHRRNASIVYLRQEREHLMKAPR